VGLFDVQASGTLDGVCGLVLGTGSGSIEDHTTVSTKMTTLRLFNITFLGVGPVLVIVVNVDDGQTLFGDAVVVNVPGQGSCLLKDAKTFVVAGIVAGQGN
jgi:hypothetical protein